MLLEQAYLQFCKSMGVQLPFIVRWAITMTLLEVSCACFWWPPIERMDLVEHMAAHIM